MTISTFVGTSYMNIEHCLTCSYYYDGLSGINEVIPENVRLDLLNGNTPQHSSFGLPHKPCCFKGLNDEIFLEYGKVAPDAPMKRVSILAKAKCPFNGEWSKFRPGIPPDISWQKEQTLKIKSQNKKLIIFNVILILLTLALIGFTIWLGYLTNLLAHPKV